MLNGDVERPWVRVLLLDRLGDHRGVGREGARVVRDDHRTAGGRHVLDSLHLDPEPVVVEEIHQGPVHEALHPLRPSPVVELALGLDARQVGAHVVVAASGKAGTGADVRHLGVANAQARAGRFGHRPIVAGMT